MSILQLLCSLFYFTKYKPYFIMGKINLCKFNLYLFTIPSIVVCKKIKIHDHTYYCRDPREVHSQRKIVPPESTSWAVLFEPNSAQWTVDLYPF